MRARRIWISVAALAGVFVTVAVPAAVAKSKPNDSFQLKGSHGYKLQGFGSGRTVSITASKGPGVATYSSRGKVTATVMKADFGTLGTVRVRFHAERTKTVDPPKGCTGSKQKRETGVWRGKIRFKGEGGYTKVRTRKAHGTVLLTRNLKCRGPKPKPATVLNATKVDQATNTTVTFHAAKLKGSAKRSFAASEFGTFQNKAGQGTIFRTVSLTGSASAFTFNGGLTSAQVRPPSPFSGTGNFASSPSGNSWTGPLAVDFPGDPNVSLAGNGFVAFLQHATSF
jgi:hypothetical protein